MICTAAAAAAAFAGNRLEKIMKAGKIVLVTEPYLPPYEFPTAPKADRTDSVAAISTLQSISLTIWESSLRL